MFAMRNKMTNIPANYNRNMEQEKCVCDKLEDMSHIYECKILNSDEVCTKYENIYSDNIENIQKVYKRFKINMNKREIYKNQKRNHETYIIGPSLSVPCIVSGNG